MMSAETKLKLSVALKGKKRTPEFKSALSQRMKGNTRALGYRHTDDALKKISAAGMGNTNMLGRVNENAANWRGGSTYDSIHRWLRMTFGNADTCESSACEKRSVRYEYALKHGKLHARVRENYWKLCKVCHISYDSVLSKGWLTKKKHD